MSEAKYIQQEQIVGTTAITEVLTKVKQEIAKIQPITVERIDEICQ